MEQSWIFSATQRQNNQESYPASVIIASSFVCFARLPRAVLPVVSASRRVAHGNSFGIKEKKSPAARVNQSSFRSAHGDSEDRKNLA
jgi:hypothetical protein